VLVQRSHNGRKEWCLVSRSTPGKVLQWFGTKKPSKGQSRKVEQRVKYFENKGE
jgi:hypothetical protein